MSICSGQKVRHANHTEIPPSLLNALRLGSRRISILSTTYILIRSPQRDHQANYNFYRWNHGNSLFSRWPMLQHGLHIFYRWAHGIFWFCQRLKNILPIAKCLSLGVVSVNLHGKNVLTKVTQIIGKKGVLSMSQHGTFWKGQVLHLGSNVSDSARQNC